jgi:hypothetical protein
VGARDGRERTMIEREQAEALLGHPLESTEHVIGQFLVIVSGSPNGNADEINKEIQAMVARSIIDNRSKLSNLVNSLHTSVSVFDPREYFSACTE